MEIQTGSRSYEQVLYAPTGQKFGFMNGAAVVSYALPMPAGTQAIYNSSGLWYYRFADWLGTSRLAAYPTGNFYVSRAYAPFGETYAGAGTGTNERLFTGQTQDSIQGPQGIYDFLFRQHASSQGRWLVPVTGVPSTPSFGVLGWEPAGLGAVDITNPQTWNRYAYVGNNPNSNIDPLGLACKRQNRPGARLAGCGMPGLSGGGGGVSIDGGSPIPVGLFGDGGSFGAGLGGGESAVPCPDNVCSGFAIDKNGNPVWVQFIATAGGVSGYYRPQDLTNGIYEYDGQLYNSANYQALLKQLYAPQISSQCGTLSGNLSAASGGAATVNCTTVNNIQGGHANFPINCGDWMSGNCAGRWAGGLHIEGNPTTGFWGHNDTASYFIGSSFNWGTFNLWNLAMHGVVDVGGGNLFTYVFGH